jgi:signal transduction histidine kinase/CheY-like chemotaxis protein
VLATARRGVPIDLEYHVKGGRLLHVRGARLTDAEGRTTGMIGTAQDVTDRFRRAEAERANRAKNEFISRMSHELRTPLNAILGFGQLLQSSELDEDQHASVDHIVMAGSHLLDLINEILDISRIEAGQLRVSPEPVAVHAVVDEAIDLVTPIAIERSIAITAELGDDGAWVRADVQRLKQVLLNLLSNAIKYNRDGGHVRVRASRIGERVQIVVADDGPGIAPEMIERLFSPFERLGAEQTSVEGTGLGLAVSRGMLEAMGGGITVVSESGSGSAFTIDLAAADPVSPPAPTSPPQGRNAAPAGPRCDVLCIEDNRSNLALLERVFEGRPNLHLVSAGSGTEGCKLARERRPSLILLDLDLPDLPGAEVLARLKADPQISDTPVVIVSAEVSAEQLERLKAQGASAYIPKPIDIDALLGVIEHLGQARVAEATA